MHSIWILFLFGVFEQYIAQNLTNYKEDLQKKYPGYGKEFIFVPDENGKPIRAYLNNTRLGKQIGDSRIFSDYKRDVTYVYYSRKYPDGKPINQQKDFESYVNKSKPTKFITHGWMSDGTKDSCSKIKDGFLDKYDANVVIMDWSPISKNIIYPVPMMATWDVGKEYSESINYLIESVGVKPEDIHLIGHSLGAHVSGFAGRNVLNGKIGRITGLDPALPGFEFGPVKGRTIETSDADFVDVIHTCAGVLGFKTPIGHVDFYPNGGQPPQPGCSILEFIESCSHGRSWRIFASSLFQETSSMASKCPSVNQATDQKKCGGEPAIPIGDSTPRGARGIYYTDIPEESLRVRGAPETDF